MGFPVLKLLCFISLLNPNPCLSPLPSPQWILQGALTEGPHFQGRRLKQTLLLAPSWGKVPLGWWQGSSPPASAHSSLPQARGLPLLYSLDREEAKLWGRLPSPPHKMAAAERAKRWCTARSLPLSPLRSEPCAQIWTAGARFEGLTKHGFTWDYLVGKPLLFFTLIHISIGGWFLHRVSALSKGLLQEGEMNTLKITFLKIFSSEFLKNCVDIFLLLH